MSQVQVGRIFQLAILFSLLFSSTPLRAQEGATNNNPPLDEAINPFFNFLKQIDFTSRFKFEYDDNIFLTETGENADSRMVFSQGLRYEKSSGPHYLNGSYLGDFTYYQDEAVDIMSNQANIAYSYRPADQFSFGVGHHFTSIEDSNITTTIGDRVVTLGYKQFSPYVQMQYELNPLLTFNTTFNYSHLDVRNQTTDTFIDNNRYKFTEKLEYQIADDAQLYGFVGYDWDKISFPQIDQKSSTLNRRFVGLTKKYPGLVNVTSELGFFERTFTQNTDTNDENIDYKVSLESVFSVYTRLYASFVGNVNQPSLRSDYSDYSSNILSLGLSHALNPKTNLLINYSFENQEFDAPDALIGVAEQGKGTNIHTLGLDLNRKLRAWLDLDVTYTYTKRDTDFAAEGYIDNKVGVALTARY